MKTNKYYLTALFLLFTMTLFAQDCVEYHRFSGCNMDLQKGYKVYSQSKSAAIAVNDTLEFNIVFYGQKDYILSFCTRQDLYPINFHLLDPGSRVVLYDNAGDRYIESLGIGFEATRALIVQVTVFAGRENPGETEADAGCIGMLLQYRSYSK
ncbi:MAG: hypothetical protein KAT15_24970 [Bacteroidales bacterium]|nr:hypothetical protein [Bacteroidales bacterium]